MCHDVIQQIIRDVCPGCNLQDTGIEVDCALAHAVLKHPKDPQTGKRILTPDFELHLCKELLMNTVMRNRVKLEEELPITRTVRRVGFAAAGSLDMAFSEPGPVANAEDVFRGASYRGEVATQTEPPHPTTPRGF